MASHPSAIDDALGLHRAGRLAEAEQAYRRILADHPQHPDALHLLGLVAHQSGRSAEALVLIQRATQLAPGQANYHNNLGEVYRSQGELELAQASYRRALEIDPRLAAAHYNLGLVLAGDQPQAAQRHYEQAIAIEPNHALAHNNLGNLLRAQGQGEAAVESYREAIRCQPAYADPYVNLAVHLSEAGQVDAAVAVCEQGLRGGAASAALWASFASGLMGQGRGAEALEAFRRALALGADSQLYSNYLYALNFVSGQAPQEVFEAHRDWARRFAEPLSARRPPHTVDRDPNRRLRVGYVSPYFREHAVNFFVEPLIWAHDRAAVEVVCYSSVPRPDAVTQRLRAAVDQWRDASAMNDEALAELVRADRIDVLVDLSGHMGVHRLLTFARRPAPVQVTYLGYQNTTGMSAMDYRLTDAVADPPGMTDALYTEHLVRLPGAFFCCDPLSEAPCSPLPALANGHVTLGSFNNYAKVQPAVVDTWMRLLGRLPGARLLVLANRGGHVERHLHAQAAAHGVDAARVEVVEKRPRADYLQLVARADIALDPFPMNGHTTTCDALWMGVPVVTMQGATYSSRFGSSPLVALGLERECIARSVEEYIEKVCRLASDVDRLESLRAELRTRIEGSVVMDARGFAERLEAAYRKMWHTWCAAE